MKNLKTYTNNTCEINDITDQIWRIMEYLNYGICIKYREELEYFIQSMCKKT